jgi:hypothetical protein
MGFIGIFWRRRARRSAAAWAPPVILMGFVLMSPLAIGYRHILPVLPFVIVVGGGAASVLLPDRQAQFGALRAACCAGLIAWLVIGTIAIYPHHLSYFNEIAGGPAQADRILVDSNLDWGQDLPALKQLLAERQVACVNLSYFGTALPAAYGVRYSPLPGFVHFLYGADVNAFNPYTPEPGWYAISATSRRLGTVWSNNDLYSAFRDQDPIAQAGYSIGLYEIKYPPDMPVMHTVVIGTPAYVVPTSTLGLAPNSRVNVKWVDNVDSAILVDGPARYVTDNPLPFDSELSRAFKTSAERADGAWIADAGPTVQASTPQWQAMKPQLPGGTPIDWPVRFNEQIDLIGFKVDPAQAAAGAELGLTTYWRVSSPLDPCTPLAMFVHIANDHLESWGNTTAGIRLCEVWRSAT